LHGAASNYHAKEATKSLLEYYYIRGAVGGKGVGEYSALDPHIILQKIGDLFEEVECLPEYYLIKIN